MRPGGAINKLAGAARIALEAIEPNSWNRDGLDKTPSRWAAAMHDLTGGHDFELTTFPNSPRVDEMVVEVGVPFFSLCEHHLLPFFGHVTVGYIPDRRIVGISKLARTVDKFSRRLQVQERMTQQIADFLRAGLRPIGVGVLVRARHLCQEMRGVRKFGTETVTSCLSGRMRTSPTARAEFLALARSTD